MPGCHSEEILFGGIDCGGSGGAYKRRPAAVNSKVCSKTDAQSHRRTDDTTGIYIASLTKGIKLVLLQPLRF